LQTLYCAIAGLAFHDSADRYPRPKCHPTTRTEILNALGTWASENDVTGTILWLHVPGSGKSVAQSFLISNVGTPLGVMHKRLSPMLAFQLVLLTPELKRAIFEQVEADPSVTDGLKALSTQLQKLIMEPCQRSISIRLLVVVIVMDGLDECEGPNIRARSSADTPLTLQFLIASRPKPQIQELFAGPLDQLHRPLDI
ncbi:hypothetical protein B0H17DRAFT_1299110, partial [Mycena rosella]